MNTENAKINFFDNAILIGAVSVFGYMVAFSYEYGYMTYFGISPSFIEINITNIFISIVASFVIFFALFSLINIFSTSGLIDNDTAIGRSRSFAMIFLIPFALSKIFIYGSLWKEWILINAVVFGLIFIEFISSIIFHKDKKALEEKLLKQEESESKMQNKNLFGKIFLMIGRMPFLFILIVFFFLLIANDVGRSEAMKQKAFPVIGTSPPSVAIRIYSQNIVSISFDRENKKLQEKLFVLTRESLYQQGLYLDYQDVGPLIKQ